MHFLLENCKFGSSLCVYSHDKTYLPSGRWWDHEGKLQLLQQISFAPNAKENSAFMPYMFGLADNRLAWASAHGVEMEEVYGHWRDLALDGYYNACRHALNKSTRRGSRGGRGGGRGSSWHSGLDLDDFDDDDDSETEERMNNFGFTEDEVHELLCQGVKPWDDDAHVSVLLPLFISVLILAFALGCP